MKEYFELQIRLLNRKMIEIGISPVYAYPLVVFLFVGISAMCFYKTDYAEYYFGISALYFISKLSGKRRNDFLKTIFSVKNYYQLRILENLLLTTPFVIVLVYYQSWVVILVLALLALLLSIVNMDNNLNFTMPTPFGKRPFEFTIGFRTTFFVFPIAYFLTYQAVVYSNFNLGVFSMLLIGMIVLSYYLYPEKEYYIWSFDQTSNMFLWSKIITGLVYFTLLSLPIIIALGVYFTSDFPILLLMLFLCYTYIVTIVLVKYAAYPGELNLPQGIVLAISLMFPPLLLAVIPFYYSKSIKKLKPILDDD